MADEKGVRGWVDHYYGADDIDLKKPQKFDHVVRTAQFASLCYYVEINSTLAHIDWFKANTTHPDTATAQAAELVAKLLEIKFSHSRSYKLTHGDFDAANGAVGMFKASLSSPIPDSLKNDFIALVETCVAHYPDMGSDADTYTELKALNKDIKTIKADHIQLMNVSANKGKSGALTSEEIYDMLDMVKTKASKVWVGTKEEEKKSKIELNKIRDATPGKIANLGLQTIKVGALGAGTAASIGAVLGGAFWPALFLIPIFAIGKRWLPDFAKAAGGVWGNIKSRIAGRRAVAKALAKQAYIESGGNLKGLDRRHRLLLNASDIGELNKQIKVFRRFYGPDNYLDKTVNGINLSKLKDPVAVTDLVPADARDRLQRDIGFLLEETPPGSGIFVKADKVSFEDLRNFANTYETLKDKLPAEDKNAIKKSFSEAAKIVTKELIFDAEMPTVSYPKNANEYLTSDTYGVAAMLKDGDPESTRAITNSNAFMKKESIKLTDTDLVGTPPPRHKSFREYINSLTPTSVTALVPTSFSDAHAQAAAEMINNLTKNGVKFDTTLSGHAKTLVELRAEINAIADPAQKTTCANALDKKMDSISQGEQFDQKRDVMNILYNGESINGKYADLGAVFAEFDKITFENINSAENVALYVDLGKFKPEKAANYLQGKYRSALFEKCQNYISTNKETFKSDITKISEFLKVTNGCAMLDDYQKAQLARDASQYITNAFDNKFNNLLKFFVERYDVSEFEKYNEGYANGGFKELFESDQSTAVQDIKDNVDYMIGVQDMFKALKFGDQYDINKDEAKYIARAILTDMSTSTAIKRGVGGTSDPLRTFITTNINNMSGNFTNGFNPGTVTGEQPYVDLKNALIAIQGMPNGTAKEKYDRYTALLILKNKCVSIFRMCMKSYVQQNSSGLGSNAWIAANGPLVANMKDTWNNGIMKEIDDEIRSFTGSGITMCAGTTTAGSELSKYGSAEEIIRTYGEKQL